MDIKERVLDQTNITEIVGSYIQLNQKGASWWGCCPFHKEKTPSLQVRPSRQSWHCFGCHKGGNVIDFVMEAEGLTFIEALRNLAKKAKIDMPEKSESFDPVKASHREALLAANSWAQVFFTQEFEKSEAARNYVDKRWGLQFAREIGIGYAPNEWHALQMFAMQHNLNIDHFKEVGLIKTNDEKNTTYDFYRERITIPIRNRVGELIGFTARYIGRKPDVAKYFNPCESDIYRKSDSIFGIDSAAHAASQHDMFYLVEGGPDVLRLQSIDVANAIAPLGTAWTAEHFKTLRKYTNNVCFIPDGDALIKISKEGKEEPTCIEGARLLGRPETGVAEFAPGITAVIHNGLNALDYGLNVSVKELPQPQDTKEKVDCDSVIKSADDLMAIEKADFIIWYAKKLVGIANREIESQRNVINRIVDALLKITDDVKASLYVDELSPLFQQKGILKKSYAAAFKEHQRTKTVKSRKADVDLIDQYGFWIENDCYYSTGGRTGTEQWSNFTLTPLFHIKDVVYPKRLFKITNGRQTEIIELKSEDLVSIQKFRQKVEGLGNFIWKVKDEQLIRLKAYLYEQTETAVEIKQLGWNKDGFFAFGNGLHYDGTFYEADDLGIVRLEEGRNYYLPSKSSIYAADRTLFEFEKNFSHYGFGTCTLTEAFTKIATVYGDNGIIGLAFYVASLFKDLVLKNTSLHFPILNLFGPKGSGKTELAVSLKRFFQLKDIPLNLNNTTIAAIANNLAQVSNAIVHFDEFRNDLDTKIRESLKGVWDGTGRSRMNIDRDKQVESTMVDSALILSGQEMATADIALFSRFVFLRFSETTFSTEAKRNFNELSELQRKGFSHITLQLLNYRPQIDRELNKAVKEVNQELTERLGKTIIEDRILGNYEVLLAVYKIMAKYLMLPFTYAKVFDICYNYMVEQQAGCFKNNELTNFWECVQVLVQNGDLTIESDFRIIPAKNLKTDVVEQEFLTSKLILYIRPSRVFQLYQKQYRSLGETCLPRTSLKYYLENSKEYLGIKNSMRFKFIVKGQEVRETVTNADHSETSSVVASQFDRAMCFDYEAIKNNYNIDINSYVEEDLPE